MWLTELNVHPVKSTAPRRLQEASVLVRGLADDRSWVVVDDAGVMVSARELPPLFTVACDTPSTSSEVTGSLRLRAPGAEELTLADPAAGDERVSVRLFGQDLTGLAAGSRVDAWLREVLGREDVRLVWCDDPSRRRLNPAYDAAPGDHTAFADAAPVNLASQASLAQLNDWIRQGALERGEDAGPPVPMQRFRPNLVIDGDEAFAEDGWSAVQVGQVRFRVVNRTRRCVMTTIDPPSLAKGPEPLRTLGRHRRGDRGSHFAVDLVPESPGTIRVGDEVTPIVRRVAEGR